MTNWYCTTTGAGLHDGSSEANAFDLAEAISEINTPVEGWVDGDIMWVKANAIYTTGQFAITNAGAALNFSSFKGYTTNIGDNGIATLERSAGTGILVDWISANYWHIENFIIDGKSAGTNCFRGTTYTYQKNLEFKNAGTYGCNSGHYLSCYAHNCGNMGFYKVLSAMDCISENNGGYGYQNGYLNFCIGKGNTNYNFYLDGVTCSHLISDGGNEDGFQILRANLYNSVAINAPVGKFGFQTTWGGHFYNIDFYNCDGDEDPAGIIVNKHTVDPEFNDTGSLDYTRTGTNLDDLGYSIVGLLTHTADYNIDIGIDQKEASVGGGEHSHVYVE